MICDGCKKFLFAEPLNEGLLVTCDEGGHGSMRWIAKGQGWCCGFEAITDCPVLDEDIDVVGKYGKN